MVSKRRPKDEKSSEAPSSLVPSLPEDVIIDILARSSRLDFPKLSLVSKHFRSLIASPDVYARRSLLACRDHCLYVVFHVNNTMDMWYILRRKANGTRCLAHVPSTLPVLHGNEATSVALGSRIYVFGGMDHENKTTNALSMDCRSHTVEPLPNIPVPMYSRMSCIFDEKIYVMGYCSLYREKSIVVFNIKTQTWEHVMTTPKMNKDLNTSYVCAVMADQIYTMNCYGSYVYEPKESKWGTDPMLTRQGPVWANGCVVDDVLYYYDWDTKTLRAYDPNQKSWGVVQGLEELLAEPIYSDSSYAVNYGGNIALVFRRRSKIWCAEISLERRQGGKVWGKVEWCDPVLTEKFGIKKCLAVMV